MNKWKYIQGQSRAECDSSFTVSSADTSSLYFALSLSQHTTQHVQLQRIQKGKQYKQTNILSSFLHAS